MVRPLGPCRQAPDDVLSSHRASKMLPGPIEHVRPVMLRFRFTIAGFFLVLTLVALGLAATVSQSELAGHLAYTVFLALLCLAMAGAILRTLPARAFWLGFALFGGVYWLVEFESEQAMPQRLLPGGVLLSSASSSSANRPRLISHHLIRAISTSLSPNRSVGSKVIAQWRGGSYYSGTITLARGDQYLIVWDDGSAAQWTPATQIMANSQSVLTGGHSLCGGLFALLGGVLAAILFAGPPPTAGRKDDPQPPTATAAAEGRHTAGSSPTDR
jgi:hypothetical protein